MSPATNPDNGMMENQQAEDLGHALDKDAAPDVKGAAVESPIPRLPEGVDADGLLEKAQSMPDEATEKSRQRAAETAQAPSRRG